MIIAVKSVFTLATLCFAAGAWQARRNNALHRRLMLLGLLFTLGIAVTLVLGVHVMGSTYGPAGWLVQMAGGPAGAKGWLLAHRALATLTFVLLCVQVEAGWRRRPRHRRLAPVVLVLWGFTYLSGLTFFV